MKRDRILLTGAKGQLGETFSKSFKQSILSQKHELLPIDLDEMNLLDKESMLRTLSELSPSVIVNCAAYTYVDKAEEEHELSKRINDEAVQILARWADDSLCRLIQISTDYVFDGTAGRAYSPSDMPNPLGVYGKTKLAAERHVSGMYSKQGVVIRTSWLYSMFGNNFVKSMLRLMAERKELSVVEDQIGSPTSANSLVKVLFAVLDHYKYSGIFHWTDGANISWHDFALEIQSQAYNEGMLFRKIPIGAIKTSAYAAAAKRPMYSVLNRQRTLEELSIEPSNWKIELGRVLKEISSSERNFYE